MLICDCYHCGVADHPWKMENNYIVRAWYIVKAAWRNGNAHSPGTQDWSMIMGSNFESTTRHSWEKCLKYQFRRYILWHLITSEYIICPLIADKIFATREDLSSKAATCHLCRHFWTVKAILCFANPLGDFLQGTNLPFQLRWERVEQRTQVAIHGRK